MNWAKNARFNSSGYSPVQRVIGRGYKLPWSRLDEKQSGELASLELPDHSRHGCGLHDVPSKPWTRVTV